MKDQWNYQAVFWRRKQNDKPLAMLTKKKEQALK